MNNHRRDFLKGTAAILGGVFFADRFGLGKLARANGRKHKFVLSIHAGSFDGFASGLLQPQKLGSFPSGVFEIGKVAAAANPFLMEHTQSGSHILHHYNRFLEDVSGNLLHVTATAGSLDHNVARLLQKTGSGFSGSPHWVMGAGQLLRNTARETTFAVADNLEGMSGASAANMVAVQGSTVAALRLALGQPRSIREVAAKGGLPQNGEDALLQAMKKSFQASGRASVYPGSFQATYESSVSAAYKGVPELAEDLPTVLAAVKAINSETLKAAVEAKLGKNPETEAIVENTALLNALAGKLQLAAILAATGFSPSMAITMPVEDRHAGGSQVLTARTAALMWAGLVLFWKFIEAQNMKDDCLCIVTHEFGRTAWNNQSLSYELNHDGKSISVVSRGTDHHLANGVYLLSGKFGTSGRLGGVLAGFAGAGAPSFDATPSLSIPAPTTLAVVGSALMGVFPESFRHPGQEESGRVVRAIWPGFEDAQILAPLRDI